ncbi:folate-binding protein YgfZ [Thalassococcus sp. S3]|uniref:CAF17-like 4Fe-4S cluster assembly/insertion protein YgfZ n=1 Tax=Thalassococcus sp. S3 TaxID=2017482 RepID=UPI001024542F|nr:folate-binding protein YgfZ [Thalassococcus sp. S3]QBF31127.1 folate-binding protein YgfZ [Thalassococcus sp. S3]
MASRRILSLTGSDVHEFLQGLVTNDVSGLSDGLVYTAILTPQGKYIADFFMIQTDDAVLIDVAEEAADMLAKRLTMYKLRADVSISDTDIGVQRGTGPVPDGALPDPRHPELGWRAYSEGPEADDGTDWTALRVAHCIPETGIELTGDTFILEAGFEALNGVDFKKGCYVGQEVTARMKHKTELRKGLARITISEPVPVGSEIEANGKLAGTVLTQAGGEAIAYLRFDRAKGDMQAAGAHVKRV